MASRYEGPYRAQVGPTAPTPLPGAGAEEFGAAAFAGLAEVGGAIHRSQVKRRDREIRLEREAQATDAGVRLAELTGEIEAFTLEARETAAPGGAGHSETVRRSIEERGRTFLETIADERVRNAFRERVAELATRVATREMGWEAGMRIERTATNIDRAGTLAANNLATLPGGVAETADAFEQALGDIRAQVDLLTIADDAKDKLARAEERKLAISWANAMQLRDHDGLLAVLDKGVLNGLLEGGDLDQLRRGALVEQRRAAVEAARVQSEEEAQAREALGLFNDRIAAGEMPSPEEFAQARALAEKHGLERTIFQIEVAESEIAINRETRDWTRPMYEAAIAELRAKGDGRTGAEDVQLAQLERIAGRRVAEIESNFHAWAAERGSPAPPLDGTPEAAARRAAWARATAKANGLGYVPYLSNAELAPLRERLDTGGAAGLVEVAGSLRGQFGAGVGGAIARQLSDDRKLQLMVGLGDRAANLFTRGAAAGERIELDKDMVRLVWEDNLEALPRDEAMRSAVLDTASAIARGIADQANTAMVSQGQFEMALHVATGSQGSGASMRGGIHEYNGRRIWLPPYAARGAFEAVIARARPEQWVAAGGGSPHFLDAQGRPGRVAYTAELRAAQLETVSPGRYKVLHDGGYLVDGNGRHWILDFRKLAR